jgi:hypothetical protein
MKALELAIVFPITGMPGNDNAVRTQVWAQTSALLQPTLGRVCRRFEPAGRAWNQNVQRPFGVILGRSDPALFLYFYGMGKSRLDEAVKYHLDGALDSCDITDKQETSTTVNIVANPKPGCEKALIAHLLWHSGMMAGEIFPDAGLYFASSHQSCINDKLDQDILNHVGDYAIAMVRFYAEVQDA